MMPLLPRPPHLRQRPLASPTPAGFEAKLTGNSFLLPKIQPAIPQRSTAAAQVIQPIGTNSFGANLVFVRVQAFNNLFVQTDNGYPSYSFTTYRERQIGLSAYLLDQAKGNTFRTLAVGIRTDIGTGEASEVRGNLFDDCQFGLDVSTRYFTGTSGAYPGLSDPVLFSSCNTFRRNPTRPGASVGIYREAYPSFTPEPQLYIDEPQAFISVVNAGMTILKDLFDENGNAPGAFYALYNASTQPLGYTTFHDYTAGNGYYTKYQQFIGGNTNIQQGNVPPDPIVARNTCHWEPTPFNTGIQTRASALTTNKIGSISPTAQAAPNPSSGSTLIHYQVPPTARQAQLLLRRGVDGSVVERVPLDVRRQQQTLPLSHYSPGLYFYTLLVDGIPTTTNRLLVE